MSWALWDWLLTWLTNHHPSVLWHCWLGHLTRKTVSEMTYNVSSGTLNPTLPYHCELLHQPYLTWWLCRVLRDYFMFLNICTECYNLHTLTTTAGVYAWNVENLTEEQRKQLVDFYKRLCLMGTSRSSDLSSPSSPTSPTSVSLSKLSPTTKSFVCFTSLCVLKIFGCR